MNHQIREKSFFLFLTRKLLLTFDRPPLCFIDLANAALSRESIAWAAGVNVTI